MIEGSCVEGNHVCTVHSIQFNYSRRKEEEARKEGNDDNASDLWLYSAQLSTPLTVLYLSYTWKVRILFSPSLIIRNAFSDYNFLLSDVVLVDRMKINRIHTVASIWHFSFISVRYSTLTTFDKIVFLSNIGGCSTFYIRKGQDNQGGAYV